MTWLLASDIAVWVGAVTGLAFVFLYAVTAPFWRSEEGWHVFTFTAALTGVYMWVAFAGFNREVPPPEPQARFWIFVVFAALLAWRLSILIRTQVRTRNFQRK